MNVRFFFFALFLGLFGVSLASHAEETNLVIAVPNLPRELHPFYETSPANQNLLPLTTPLIVGRDEKSERLICFLCPALPTLNNGGIALTQRGASVKFSLKKGLRWGDGYPVTLQDVAFTLDVMATLPPENPYKSYRDRIDQATIQGDVMTLSFPEVHAMADLLPLFPLLPEHLERGRFAADPANYSLQTQYRLQPDDVGLSYGPFAFAKQGMTNLVLRRNPAYPRKEGTASQLELRTYQKDALIRDVKAGDVDRVLRYQSPDMSDYVKLMQSLPVNTYTASWNAEPYLMVMDVSGDVPPAVRRALAQSVDWAQLSTTVFNGRLIPTNSIFRQHDARFAYTGDIIPDEAALSTALTAAGWQKKDGTFYKSERSLSFPIVTLSGQPTLLALQQVLSNSLKKQGIDTNLATISQGVFYGEQLPRRSFDGIALYIVPTTGDPFMNWLRSVYSVTGADASVPALLDQLALSPSEESEQALWDQIQAHIAAEPRFIPLFFTPSLDIQKTTWQTPTTGAPLSTAGTWVRR